MPKKKKKAKRLRVVRGKKASTRRTCAPQPEPNPDRRWQVTRCGTRLGGLLDRLTAQALAKSLNGANVASESEDYAASEA